jgi:hypothetical protein
VTQAGLFGAEEEPKKVRAYLLKKPELPPEPVREEPRARAGGLDIRIHLAAGRSAASGTRYCFEHEKWEFNVGIYLDGRRWVFYCPEAARERGAKKFTGNQNKPTGE